MCSLSGTFTIFLIMKSFSKNVNSALNAASEYNNESITKRHRDYFAACGNTMLTNDTSCYDNLPNDDLPRADDKYTTFPENTIFFHETSCKGGLDERQACSIESAARAHPNRTIAVLFAGPVSKSCLEMNPMSILLKTYQNIELCRIHLEKYSQGTPLQTLVTSRIFKRSLYPIHHTSDVLRYLTLYKFGGIYLDLDMIVLKPFDKLPASKNFVGKDFDDILAAGILAFSKSGVGKKLSNEALRILRKKFNPFMQSYNGVGVIKDTLQKICSTAEVPKMTKSTCQGLEVYDPDYFYPVGYGEFEDYYKETTLDLNEAYTAHLWNSLAADVVPHEKSPYAYLKKKYCPRVDQMQNNFHFTDVKRTRMDVMTFYFQKPPV